MDKRIISTTNAPSAIGPYSQAVVHNGTLYVSGQIPIDPATGLIPDTLEAQVAQALKNVLALVEAAGSTPRQVLKCGLFIRDMDAFGRINQVYETFFPSNPPARFVVEVSRLPKDVQIEIDAIAAV